MENLAKQKEQIERELKEYKENYNTLINIENEAKERLEALKCNKYYLSDQYEALKEKLKQKKALFVKLKSLIKEYKQHKYKDIEEIYKTKYNNIIENINSLHWNFNLQIFSSFESLNGLLKEAESFKNLKNEIKLLQHRKNEHLKALLIEEISKTRDIHNMIYLIKFVQKYEIFFNEKLFLTCTKKFISQRYKYHFLSDSETNRLDKAEWIFNFLDKKLKEVCKFLTIYNTSENKVEPVEYQDFLENIIKTIIKLINKRIKEIEEIDSKQKRNLILNFNYFLSLFINKIAKEYNVNLETYFSSFENEIVNQEKKNILFKVQDIHKHDYTSWFSEYEEVFKEILDLNKKQVKVDVNFFIDHILDFNLVFIDSMRYINRKEIHVLLYIFNMFETFKETVQFLLEEFYQENGIDTEDKIDEILIKISKFNLENFKLIKTLFENDINNIINLKFYFINDLYKIFEDYKICKGFNKLKDLASNMIDKYLFNTLAHKPLDRQEYSNYLNLFKKLKEYFDVKKWDSRECMKCIKGIFENKNVDNKFSKFIRDLYLQ